MSVAATKRVVAFSNHAAISISSITFWVDGLCFIALMAFLALYAPLEVVGMFALGWGVAIPWSHLSDVPSLAVEERVGILPLKGLSILIGLSLVWGASILFWGNPMGASFAAFGFLWKGLDSAEHLFAEKPIWFREIRGPATLGVFYALWHSTGMLDLAVLAAALWSLAHFWLMGWKEVGNLSWSQSWALGKRFRRDDSALALASLLLLVPFIGVCLWYGPQSGAYLALTGFWIFLGNWLWNKTHPHWGRSLKLASEKNDLDYFARHLLRFFGLGFLLGLAWVLGIYLSGTLFFGYFLPEVLRFHHGLFVGMTLAAGLFWINALFCLGRSALPESQAPWKFLLWWVFLQTVFSLFLIPYLGIEGASWTLVLTAGLMIPHQWILLEREMRKHFSV